MLAKVLEARPDAPQWTASRGVVLRPVTMVAADEIAAAPRKARRIVVSLDHIRQDFSPVKTEPGCPNTPTRDSRNKAHRRR
jgi:hypothetical protein